MKNDITSSRTMYEVLAAPDRLKHEVKGVSGVLAFLWRTILEQRNIGLGKFDHLTTTYIVKARRAQSSAKIANYFSRSNIFREMSRPSMTWKVFIKGMQLIGISRMKLTIELEGRGGTSVHSTSLTLAGEDSISYEELADDEENREKVETAANPATVGADPAPTGEPGKE